MSDCDRLLLLEAREPSTGHRFWLAPGGGLEQGESFETAARRELQEETGLICLIGPWVWTRRHIHTWEGHKADQYERFYVVQARVAETDVNPLRQDGYVMGYRWWGLAELEASTEDFAPRRLAQFLGPILRGEYPDSPVECGV